MRKNGHAPNTNVEREHVYNCRQVVNGRTRQDSRYVVVA